MKTIVNRRANIPKICPQIPYDHSKNKKEER